MCSGVPSSPAAESAGVQKGATVLQVLYPREGGQLLQAFQHLCYANCQLPLCMAVQYYRVHVFQGLKKALHWR